MNNNSCFTLAAAIFLLWTLAVGQIGAVSLKTDQAFNSTSPSTASTTTTTTTTTTTEMSRKFDLEHNPLRIGFEPFYAFANMFIDSTMHFNIPESKQKENFKAQRVLVLKFVLFVFVTKN